MDMEKQQYEQVDRNIKEAQEKLEAEMEAARHEHQVVLMRQGAYGLVCRHLNNPAERHPVSMFSSGHCASDCFMPPCRRCSWCLSVSQ